LLFLLPLCRWWYVLLYCLSCLPLKRETHPWPMFSILGLVSFTFPCLPCSHSTPISEAQTFWLFEQLWQVTMLFSKEGFLEFTWVGKNAVSMFYTSKDLYTRDMPLMMRQ
jgi:hypothetical protein